MTESFDVQLVRDIAHLTRLDLPPERLAEFGEQLGRIVEYFDLLDEVDTTDVAPTAHPLDLTNVLRDDVERRSASVGQALSNAPDHDEVYFRVPKVLYQKDA